MRILSQINPFKEGDIVTVKNEPGLGKGVVSLISQSSHYYEARPIASYQTYRIRVDFESNKNAYYKIEDLEAAS